MLSSCTRIGLSFYYGAAACTTFGYILMYDAWRIAPIRFNNVSLWPSIFIPNISACCGVRAYKTWAVGSRDEVSSVGTIEEGWKSTQVPNSCRKWHRIHIVILIHSPLYMAHSTFR
jgi:hypothetical protein